MLDRIRTNLSEFNRLLADHGKLWLKTYLKYEHQRNTFHWILADLKSPGEFDGDAILQIRHKHEKAFKGERDMWLQNIICGNKEITDGQINHLWKMNKRLNLAFRLVESFQKDAALWSLQPKEQVYEIVSAVQRMKALTDFFVRYNQAAG